MYATWTDSDLTEGPTPVLVRRLGSPSGQPAATFAVWQSERDAQAGAPGATAWTVVDRAQGRSASEQPTAVQVTWFDGPRSPEQTAADQRAGRERIWPAVRDVEGLVDVFILVHPRAGMAAINAVTDPAHLEVMQRRIMSSELLPGEDPALLRGPDRVEVVRVLPRPAHAAGSR